MQRPLCMGIHSEDRFALMHIFISVLVVKKVIFFLEHKISILVHTERGNKKTDFLYKFEIFLLV